MNRRALMQEYRTSLLTQVFKPRGIPTSILLMGTSFLILGSFYFLLEQTINPPCCDATNYLDIASGYEKGGIATVVSDLRTFGYPWFLTQTYRLADFLVLPPIIVVLALQLAAYYASVLAAAHVAARHSVRLASTVYLALCANIFVIPYFSVTLTDSLYTSICLLLIVGVAAIDVSVRKGHHVSFIWVAGAAFLSSIAVIVRPAAIWLGPPLFVYFIILLFRRRISIPTAIAGVTFGASPLFVQSWLNLRHFGTPSFLPAVNLGELQTQWGMENFKYATWLGGGDPRNFYPSNVFLGKIDGDMDLGWWISNIPESVIFLALKFVGAFDFDFLVPYPYSHPWYSWILAAVGLTVLILGAVGVLRHLKLPVELNQLLGPRWFPLALVSCWAGATLITAVELRFTLPMITYLLMISAALGWQVVEHRQVKFGALLLGIWIVSLPLLMLVALFIRRQGFDVW